GLSILLLLMAYTWVAYRVYQLVLRKGEPTMQLLQEIYQTQTVRDSQGNEINPFPTSTAYDLGTTLQEFIQKNHLERTLEIGMAYGLSTLFFCQAHHERGRGSHIAIDPMQHSEWKSIGVLNVQRAGYADKFRFFEACADEVLPQLIAQGEKIDFAFIDGSHLFDYVLVDFFLVDKLLEVGGYVVFDDIWMTGIRKVVSFILANRDYELVNFDTKASFSKRLQVIIKRFFQNPFEGNCQGMKYIPSNICVLKKVSDDRRPWDYHRSF
ncbi:class I SAM-dependent methyltransferase, partial [Scytonema sp. NUACC26]|uniref:class I SAM-dependent methyltransferase n=1 Tax=Scytonema sp. NUACC26 TaxID=3140176 RepID=UPI0038B2986B